MSTANANSNNGGQQQQNKTTTVRLELHAQQLKNVAGTFKGKSDPFAIVTLLANDPTQQPRVVGKTEVLKNTLSPRWTTTFELNYCINSATRINVGVWDEVSKGENKPMGSAVFEVGEVLGSRGNTKAKLLRKGGTLFCRITSALTVRMGSLRLGLQGVKLKNMDGMFGKSDPFIEVSSKVMAAGGLTWQPIYRSKHIDNDLNPTFPVFRLDIARLCEGDLNRPILVELWDWEKSGNHDTMGKFETSVNGLLGSLTEGSGKTVNITNSFIPMHKGKKFGHIVVIDAELEGYKPPPSSSENAANNSSSPPANNNNSSPSGFAAGFGGGNAAPPPQQQSAPPTDSMANLNISQQSSSPAAPYVAGGGTLPRPIKPPISLVPQSPQQDNRALFVEYLSGGCEIELTVAIDFTGSNGDPRKSGTLHYIHQDGQLNDYEKAITGVGTVVARYDTDQKVPVFGFGAKYGGMIQHCFQVGPAAELDGIGGILEGYRAVFQTGLTMSGPTVFDEVIQYAAATARSKQEASRRIGQQAYKLLLILTDGAVSDLEATKQAIVAASDAPMSIVIVGIGNADFSAMQHLDDFAVGRDIVQFVQFNQHASNRSALAAATLEEIPDQLVEYFKSQGMNPLPPISGSQISLFPEEANDEDIDLSMDIAQDGEISLVNYNGAVYDDTKYGTINNYNNIKPLAPPGGGQSGAYVPNQQPSAPYTPQQQQQPYAPSAPLPQEQAPSSQQPYTPTQQQAPTQLAAPAANGGGKNPVFHVQVPPNCSGGMQIQLKNPFTGQQLIVTIPPGLKPGDKFGVQG